MQLGVLKKRAVVSLLSAYSVQFATAATNLISKLVLARLLIPEDWGLFAEATLIISVASTLRDLGLRPHLLRESERPYGNVLLLQVIASVIAFAILQIIAPVFTFFSPQIPNLVRLLAVSLLFTGISATADIYIDRELIINRSILARVTSLGLNIGISILLALSGWGVWSLVWGTVLSAGIYTTLIWRSMADARLEFTLAHTRVLLAGSKYLFLLSMLGLVSGQVDVAIIGGMLSPLEVGYYSMAAWIILKPTSIIELSIGRVILPVFAELANDRQRLGRIYRLATVLTYAIEVPIYAFIFFYPETIVRLLLGEQWMPVVPVVRVMVFYGIINPVGTFGWEIIKVVRKDWFFTLLTLGMVLIQTVSGLGLIKTWGIYGMIAGTYLSCLLIPLLWKMMAQIIGNEFFRLVLNLAWIYGISFFILGIPTIVSSQSYVFVGLSAIGFCWLILLLPYRDTIVSFLPVRSNPGSAAGIKG